jgi:aromatic-L-amino-acid decarboxylase
VREAAHLTDTFSFHPSYYRFEDSHENAPPNYYEYGPQNSRGFRALKIWLALQHIGRTGYTSLLRENISLARTLYAEIAAHPVLQACSYNLSITTCRFIPPGLDTGDEQAEAYLNELNEALLKHIQNGGEFFISNAVIDQRFVLRASLSISARLLRMCKYFQI